MEHFQIAFRFHECQSLRKLRDVISLAQMLPGYGFLPAESPTHPKPSHDIEALVRHQWKPNPRFCPEKPFDAFPQYRIFFRVLPVTSSELLATFSCKFYSLDHSTVELGTFADIEPLRRSSDVELCSQNLLELALSLYPHLSPSYGWVDEDDATDRWVTEAIAAKLRVIGWANFFGPSYVNKYGRDFLLGLPGWKVEELDDGGVFQQLTPSILASDREATQHLQSQVVEYCRHAGLRVQCRGPYRVQ